MDGFFFMLGCYVLADAYCYVHGHNSMFFTARKDYEKRIIEKLRGGE